MALILQRRARRRAAAWKGADAVLPSAAREQRGALAGIIMMTSSPTRRPSPFLLGTLLFLMPLFHVAGLGDPFALPRSALLHAGALALLAEAALGALRSENAPRLSRVGAVVGILFLIASGLAAGLSVNRGLALRGLADLAALVVVAWGAFRLASEPAKVATLFRATLAAAALVAAGLWLQVLLPGFHLALGPLSLLPPSPAGSTLGDPGLAAQWLVLSLPIGVAAVSLASGAMQMIAGAALGLVAGTLVIAGRPEGWFAAAGVVVAMVATRAMQAVSYAGGWSELTPRRGGSGLWVAAVAALVAILVVISPHVPYIGSESVPLPKVGLLAPTTGDPSVDRSAAVKGTLAMIGLHPFGVGPSFWRHAFLEVAWTRVQPSPFNLNHQAIHAGNSFLELVAETGLPGGVLFAALLILAMLGAARAAFTAPGSPENRSRRVAAKAAIDALLAVVMVGMLGSCLQEIAPALVAFVAIGIGMASANATAVASPAWRRATAVIVLLLTCGLAASDAVALSGRFRVARATFAAQALAGAGDQAAALAALSGPDVARSPEHIPHALLGSVSLRSGRGEEAAAHFGDVIDRSPWFIAAFLGRAAAWEGLGRYDRAEEDLRRALSVWPGSPGVTLALGRLSARRGRLEQALATLHQAADLDPTQAEPWVAIGEIQLRQGRADLAAEAFQTAAEKDPSFPRVNILIGDALEKKGYPEIAVGFFQKAASVDSTGVEPRLRLANALHATGKRCQALDSLKAARELETDPGRRDALADIIDRVESDCRAEKARAQN
jgi:Tfp pilus assembly protein PilF